MTDLVYGTVVPTLADFGGAPAVRGDIFCNLLTEKVYIAGDGTVIEIGGGGGMAIGAPVIDGDDTRVLFIRDDGSGPVLAQDDNFRFAPSISVLFIGPVTGPGEYSQISRDGFYSASAGAVDFISLDNTDGSATLSSLAGVGTRSIAADSTGKIVVGGGTQTFSPTIIPFADGAGVLTESASLFWDGNYVNAPGIKMNAGGDNTLLRQNSNNLQIFAGATQIANLTPNNGSGGCVLSVTAQAYSAIGAEGAAPGNRNFVYALNPSTVAASSAGLWAAHNAGSVGVSSLDLFRYAASVVDNGWRVAVQQSTSDDLRLFITGAGGSSDLIARLSRDAGFFLKNVARPATSGSFGYLWADTEGSPALSGPNGDTFRWFHTAKNLAVGKSALGANASGTQNVALGFEALKLSTDSFADVAIGTSVMNIGTSSGGTNVAIGAFALANFTANAADNIAIGNGPMGSGIVSGVENIGLGRAALEALTAGERNIGIGELALNIVTTGDDNVGVGPGTLASATTSNKNSAFGAQAAADYTGDGITAAGYQAATNITTGLNDVALGYQAMAGTGSNVSDGYNVAIGYQAIFEIDGGANNVGIGYQAMGVSAAISGNNNIGVGASALKDIISGNGNIAIGADTSPGFETGDDNIAIGRGARIDDALDNCIALGAAVQCGTMNEMRLGNTSITHSYITGEVTLYKGLLLAQPDETLQGTVSLYAVPGAAAPNNADGSDGDICFRGSGFGGSAIYQRQAGAWVGIA